MRHLEEEQKQSEDFFPLEEKVFFEEKQEL